MTTRSTVLWRGRIDGTRVSLRYVVPANQIALTKNIVIWNFNANESNVSVYWLAGAAAPGATLVAEPIAPNVLFQLDTWLISLPGDELHATADNWPVDVWISGALLPLYSA